MNGKHYIGDKAVTVRSTGRTRGIDGVALVVDDGTEYTAGDQTGYVLELECPYGTQAMADTLLEKLRGRTYEGFETTGAALPMGAELGDGVTVKGLYGPIVRRRVQFVGDLAADVSAPTGGDTDHEFGYTDPTQRQLQRAAARSRSYIDKKADEIRLGVESDVDGKLSEITVDLEGVSASVRALSSDVGEVRGDLSLKVGRNENSQIVSMLNASANEINISGNRFVLDSDNFKVAADGTVEMTGANVSGDVSASAFTLQGASLEVKEDYVTSYGGSDKGYGSGGGIAMDTLLVITSDVGVKTDRLFSPSANIAHIGCNDGSFANLKATDLKAYEISENGSRLADKYLLKSDADKYMAKDAILVETGSITMKQGEDFAYVDEKPGYYLAAAVPTTFSGAQDICLGVVDLGSSYGVFFKVVSPSTRTFPVRLFWVEK